MEKFFTEEKLDPDPLVRGTDPRIRIRTKMSLTDPQHCSQHQNI
jgi:hypothetical protein